MRVFRANLRQFHQRLSLVLIYGIVGIVTALVIYDALLDAGPRRGAFAGLLIPVFVLGLMVGVMQVAVLSKPFSFCLPGHRGVVRRLVLAIGLVVSALFALPFLRYPGLFAVSTAQSGLMLCSAFCANLIAYMVGAGVGLSVKNATASVGYLPLLVFVGPAVGLHTGVERLILHSPAAVVAVTAIMVTCGWLWLGRASWFRRLCAAPRLGLFDAWDREKMEKYRHALAAAGSARPSRFGIDRLLLHRIGRRHHFGVWNCVWGVLYATFLRSGLQWKGTLFVVLLALFAGGYVPLVVAVIPLMATDCIAVPIHLKLLVVGGRSQRFVATIVLLLVVTTITLLVVGLIVLLSSVLTHVMPEVDVGSMHWRFELISPMALVLTLLIIPIGGLLKIAFHREPIMLWLSFTLFFSYLMVVFIADFGPPSALPPQVVAGVSVALAWIIAPLGIRCVAARRDLAF